ncbi:MAG: pyridoxamine 5'-phosphate oxidase family protein [Oscillospiraceae bacterium]|nr:pyridoxamine 5'-phosphate oxidase family protein [Oscillospiraceae bacterium]
MESIIKKAGEIIEGRAAHKGYNGQYCVLTQEDLDGRLTASVVTPSKAEGLQWLTFCTGLESNKCKRIRRDSRAAVCFGSEDYSITLKGRLEILTDAESRHEHWYDGMENHASGPDDPGYCVLRFRTEAYSLFVDWKEISGVL